LATNKLPLRVYCETRRLLPESVVWLCANNRVAEAEQIIRNAAKLNNITMPYKILARSDTAKRLHDDKADDDGIKKVAKLLEKFRSRWNSRKSEKTNDGSARYTLLDIFRNRHLTINMFCMVLLWSVTSFTTNSVSLSLHKRFMHNTGEHIPVRIQRCNRFRRFSESVFGPPVTSKLKRYQILANRTRIAERKISGKVLGGLYCCAKFGWLVLILRAFGLQTPTHASKITVLWHLSPYVGSIINNTTKEHMSWGNSKHVIRRIDC